MNAKKKRKNKSINDIGLVEVSMQKERGKIFPCLF